MLELQREDVAERGSDRVAVVFAGSESFKIK